MKTKTVETITIITGCKFGHLLVDITDKPTNKLTNETMKDVEWSPVHVSNILLGNQYQKCTKTMLWNMNVHKHNFKFKIQTT